MQVKIFNLILTSFIIASYCLCDYFLQIDVAINSRNSGGPAFNDKGECISIAFQSLKLEDTENIGYVILTPIIMHFIQHYEKNGEYLGDFHHFYLLIRSFFSLSYSFWILIWLGFPILGVEWQKMENLDPRMSMGIGNEHKGARIKRAYNSRI